MKNAIIAVIFSIAAIGSASAAPAGTGNDSNGTVRIGAPAPYELAISEFDDYEKTYVLEDGRHIEFTQRIDTYYVRLQGEKRTTLIPQAPGVFLTPSGARIQFRDHGETVAIRNYEKLALSRNLAADTIVMAKR